MDAEIEIDGWFAIFDRDRKPIAAFAEEADAALFRRALRERDDERLIALEQAN